MPARTIFAAGREWRVLSSGMLTQSVGDEHGVVFIAGAGSEREVRLTRFSPMGTRARSEALLGMTDAQLLRLFAMSQSSDRSPEAGYRP